MKHKRFKWLNRALSTVILFVIEATININQILFESFSFMFEEPNLKILKPLFVAVFLIIEWVGLYQFLEKIIK